MTLAQFQPGSGRRAATLEIARFGMRAKYCAWSRHFSKEPETLRSRIFQSYVDAAKKLCAEGKPVMAARRLAAALGKYHAKECAPLPAEAKEAILRAAAMLMNKGKFHEARNLCELMSRKGGAEDAETYELIAPVIARRAGRHYSELAADCLGHLEMGMGYAKKAADNAVCFNPALRGEIYPKVAEGYFELAKKEHEKRYDLGIDGNIEEAIRHDPKREREFRAFRADVHFEDFKNARFAQYAEMSIQAAIAWDPGRAQAFKSAMADRYIEAMEGEAAFEAETYLKKAIAWDYGRRCEFRAAFEKSFPGRQEAGLEPHGMTP